MNNNIMQSYTMQILKLCMRSNILFSTKNLSFLRGLHTYDEFNQNRFISSVIANQQKQL